MIGTPTAAGAIALLRGSSRDYMRTLDVPMARRLGAVAYVLTAVATLATLPFVPPTALIGPVAGWSLAAVFVAAGAGAAAWSVRARRLNLQVAYGLYVGALVGLGAMGWLAQDGDLYSVLAVVPLVLVSSIFPARWVAVALLAALAAQIPALLAAGAKTDSVVELGLHVLTWLCLSGLALMWTAGVRAQRRAMHAHARVDVLTGLGNRRAFDESLAAELARSTRTGRTLSLLVGDLDSFKEINDRHGHLAGDVCLRQVAAVVRDLTRRPDRCFRWGGDEFVVLLPEVDGDGARAVAERLCVAVGEACHTPDGRPLSLAFGVAERTGDEADPASLLARADADLIATKAD
jgi:diguanylate cyclase (GGDEF)-like protein